MSKLSKRKKIFKLLQQISQNVDKPYNFTAKTSKGFVRVEGFPGDGILYISNLDTDENWAGTHIAAVNHLEKLKLDLDSIES